MKFCLALLLACGWALGSLWAQNTRQFATDDFVYDYDVRTVLLYPATSPDPRAVLAAPVLPLSQETPLLLEFDELGEQMERLAVKIVSCNADWTVSGLNATEYLSQFNEFYITDRQLSFNTKVGYVHYRFEVPRVLLPGNYVLKVYEEGYEENLKLSRRFMVYDNSVGIASKFGSPTGVEESMRNQQIEFNLNYGPLDAPNPMQQFKVVLRQNFRWDNAIANLQPTFARPFEKMLQYQHFNLENNFKGGNEFRMFDFRSFQYRNLNVYQMNLRPKVNEIYVNTDSSRNGWAYNPQFRDNNGRYFVQNVHGRDASTEADYAEVVFSLKVDQEMKGAVYVTGGFSDWRLADEFKMKYFPEQNSYQTVLLLKQGLYDYQYTWLNPGRPRDDIFFEGSHFRTQNNYEILVYFRPIGARTDLLVGYKLF